MSDAEKRMTLDRRLSLVSFSQDPEPFIMVEKELCHKCERKPCLYVCPAQVYAWTDQLNYNTEGCLETGACLVVCHKIGAKAIEWKYPAGGRGVSFRQG